jgi:hypothetical protein
MSLALNGTDGVTYNDGTLQSSAPGGKNLIINGDMRIAQRATSVAGSTAAAAYISLDRWASHASGATYNISQDSVTVGGETGLPTTFTKYLKFNPTTGADNCGIWQTIEDVDSVQGTYTLSFYAKGTNPAGGSIGISLSQNFGSGGSTTVSTTDAETFTLTGTWQRFTFTITPPSITGKTIGTASYYRIFFNQKADDNSATAWTLDITGVQLETGTTATDFENLQYGQQLALCQRYFQSFGGSNVADTVGQGTSFSTTNTYVLIHLLQTMRSVPSLGYSAVGDWRLHYPGVIGVEATVMAIATNESNNTKVIVNTTTATNASMGGGKCIQLSADSTINARLTFSAEL